MRTVLLAGAGIALVAGLAAAGAGTGVIQGPWTANAAGTPAASPAAVPARTAAVERRTMQTAATLDASLGYEAGPSVTAGAAGTVTRLPEPGSVIERGEVLYELDGRVRPRLLYGERPLWRPMRKGMSPGADVLQLERNLQAMGHAPRGMKVDRRWDAATTRAVKRWQRATGRRADGTLDGSDLAFLPGPVRVAAQDADVGSVVSPGSPVLDATSASRVVTLSLSASRQDLVRPGQAVTIDLPGGVTVDGHVRSVGRVATAGENGGGTTVPVTIDVDDPARLPDLDAAPADVNVVTDRREDVLAVPVNALVALLEGGYAVEVVDADGSRRYTGVELGLFDDGWVEVRADGLEAGDTVVTAR